MRCCICGREFYGFCNNPRPVNKEENSECCNDCKINMVLPARIKEATDKEFKIKEKKENE